MTPDILLFLGVFVVGLILFTMEWVSADVTALGLMLSLVVLGLLSPESAFAGFGSDTVLLILGLLILTETLVNTGLIDWTGQQLSQIMGTDIQRLRWLLLIAPAIMSALMSNTASAAFFLPITLGLAHRAGINPSKLLMPMSFAAILAGSTTLIGTSTNLVVSGLMQQHDMAPLTIFELTPVGLPVLAAGLLYMAFIGHRLIPDRGGEPDDDASYDSDVDLYFTELTIPDDSSIVGKTIDDSGLLDKLGLGMLQLRRDGEKRKPLRDMVLKAGDILIVEGSREDMLRIARTPLVEVSGKIEELEAFAKDGTARIAEVVLLPGSPLIGRTLKGMGLRERYQLQILAVNRARDVRYNKIGRMKFQLGDVLLIKLPQTNVKALERDNLFRIMDIVDFPQRDTRQMMIASGIFIGALGIAITGLLPLAVAILLGVLAAFVTGCITPETAYRNIEWKTVILIGSMLAFGRAMQETGAADYLATLITSLPLDGSPHVLLTLFFFLALLLTQPMSNQAAAAVLLPIAIDTALLLDYNPRPFAIMIAIAASCSFITPLEPASLLVYSAGRYKFTDFLRVGGLLTLVVYVIAIVMVPWLWQL